MKPLNPYHVVHHRKIFQMKELIYQYLHPHIYD